jgi:hypothetical protein
MEALDHPDIPIVQTYLAMLVRDEGDHARASEQLRALQPAVERGHSPLLAVDIDAALLRCVAALGDWAEWDHRLEQVEGAVDRGYTNVEVALFAEQAADEALVQGDRERADQAMELALDMWARLGNRKRARALAAKLRS